MSETSPPTVPATSEPKPKQSRSAQDKIIGAYGAAGKDPFATKLTKRGYPAARLATLLDHLDDLTGTGGDQDTPSATPSTTPPSATPPTPPSKPS